MQIVLAIIFTAILSVRFYRITEIGVEGPDSFFYWQTALEWLRGNIPENEHFRPFIYWLYSKLFWVTGPNDWAIKALNLICDGGVALSLVYFGWLTRKNLILGLAAGVAYLSLEMPLASARSEVVHAPSAFFLSLSVLFLLKWTQGLAKKYIFLCGLCLSFAWHIHPDLAVLGAAVTLVLVLKLLTTQVNGYREFWSKTFSNFCVFLAGYWSVFFAFSLKLGVSGMLSNLLLNQKTQSKSSGSFASRLISLSYDYVTLNVGSLLALSFLLALGLLVWKALKGRLTSHDWIMLIFPSSFLFFCALLFARSYIPRLFIPLAPLLCFFIFLQVNDLLKQKAQKVATLTALSLLVLAFNHQTLLLPFRESVSVYKRIDREFSPVLKNEGNYLIAPLSIAHIHDPLSQEVYLGGRGVYLVSTDAPSLDEVIEKNNIRYVWIADVLFDKRVFGKNLKFSYEERLRTLFRMDPEKYDVDREKKLLREELRKRGAEVIHKSELGEIYELKS